MKLANADLAPKPPTMARIVELNRGPLLGEAPAARTVALPAADAQVLDVRDGASFAGGHMAGSFNDSVAVSGFGNRCGFALDPEREVVIVAETHEQAEEAARKLAAVGFTQLAEVGFGIDSAHAHARFEPVGLAEMGALADRGELQVVDVREASEQTELAAGALAGALPPAGRGRSLGARPREADRGRLPHRHALAAGGLAAGAPRLHARAAGAGRGHGRLGARDQRGAPRPRRSRRRGRPPRPGRKARRGAPSTGLPLRRRGARPSRSSR